jgi:hypothetical protein
MMEEMMKECRGPEGIPDVEKTKELMEICGCRLRERTMCMRLRGYLAMTALLGAFAVSVVVSGGTAVIAADPSPETQLSPQAQIPFQEYRNVPHTLRYRAFAVEPESGQWGQSTQLSQPGIAIDQAIEDCQRRSTRDCQVYAVGDIIVLGLADWKTEVAVVLYRVKPGATNDDLEAVTSRGGGAEVVALRRSVLHAAAEMGRTGALAAMLDRGIDVDVGSVVGATALSYAATRGRREAVALLLERGADVNARNGAGKTALGLAVLASNFARLRNFRAADHDAVIRLLADAGGID